MLSGISKIALSFLIIGGLGLPALADNVNLQLAKGDIQALYQQWRSLQPADSLTYNAFRAYLELHRVPVTEAQIKGSRWNSSLAFSMLPSGSIMQNVSKPETSDLASFLININPEAYPNIQSSDQHILIIDAQGRVSGN